MVKHRTSGLKSDQQQQQQGHQRRTQKRWGGGVWIVASMLIFASAVFVTPVSAQNTVCIGRLESADANTDNRLDREEYVRAIHSMTDEQNIFTAPYDDLDPVLKDAFEVLSCKCLETDAPASCCGGPDASIDISGASDLMEATVDELFALEDACDRIDTAIDAANLKRASPTTLTVQQRQAEGPSLNRCFVGMTIGDDNGDSSLDDFEYVICINFLSGTEYPNTNFTDLPQVLIDNYNSLRGSDPGINVFGVRPGQNPSPEQLEFLATACSEMGDAIILARGSNTPAPVPITPAPITPTMPPTPLTLPKCFALLTAADAAPLDDSLNKFEYSRFITLVVPNTFPEAFPGLPPILQEAFLTLSNGGETFSIEGARPASDPTTEQVTFLTEICEVVDSALLTYFAGPTTTPSITSSPSMFQFTGVPSLGPSLLPTITAGPTTTLVPTSTPSISTFPSTSSSPSATGSSPPSAPAGLSAPSASPSLTAVPSSSLSPSGPTSGPSISTSPSTSSSPTGIMMATVTSLFVISNADNVDAAFLNGPPSQERSQLNAAYTEVVDLGIAATFGGGASQTQRFLHHESRRRRLLVDVVANSSRTDFFVDRDCPPSSPVGSLCQEVVASFVVALTSDESLTMVRAQAKDAVDGLISDSTFEQVLANVSSTFLVEENVEIINQPSASPIGLSPGIPGQPSPTTGPTTTMIPTFNNTSPIQIENSFVISNTANLAASDLQSGSDREQLRQAYNNMGQAVVQSRSDPGITFERNSGTVADIVDTECPSSAPQGSRCQAVFAMYGINVANADRDFRRTEYQNATQSAIRRVQLQNELDMVNPNSPIEIEEVEVPSFQPSISPSAETNSASPSAVPTVLLSAMPSSAPSPTPSRTPTRAPSEFPSTAPVPLPEPDEDGGRVFNTGTIIGITLGCLVAVCLLIVFWVYASKRQRDNTRVNDAEDFPNDFSHDDTYR